jgi:hypothetical protein
MIQVRSSPALGPDGAGHITTVVVMLDESERLGNVPRAVAEQLKVAMPADTFLLLVVVGGDAIALDFSDECRNLVQGDAAVGELMRHLTTAEVMAGRQDAVDCTKASLLATPPTA